MELLTNFDVNLTSFFCELWINPIRPSLQSFTRPKGGGGLRGPDAKNQDYHQLIEMKLCMSHYNCKSIIDAKFESGSFPIFGDMTSQNFSLKKVQNRFFYSKLTLHVNFSNFRAKENFSDVSMTKEQQQSPDWSILS